MSETFFNPDQSDHDLLTDWCNHAIMGSPSETANYIRKIQEVLVHKSPDLLHEFLPNVLNFTTSKHVEVKKALLGLIEEACKVDESLLTKVMFHLLMLLCDESVVVQKRVIQVAINVYKKMLMGICKAPGITEEMEQAWNQINEIKVKTAQLVDNDNDGVRTSVVKFLECVILLQSYPDPHEPNRNDFTLEDVPLTLKIARRRKLEEEANNFFDILIKFNGSQHISSANLFVCIGVLTNIAKNRPDYFGDVVHSLVMLSTNFPPTLSTTQVNSVKKKLKTELSALIKHPASHNYVDKLGPVLQELGYSQYDIQKMTPRVDESRRYKKRVLSPEIESQPKKAKLDDDVLTKQKQAIDLNESYIKEKLTALNTVDIVLKALHEVPTKMPPSFKNDYLDTLKLGPGGDVKVIAKLLAEQMVESGVGPGSKIIGKTVLIKEKPEEKNERKRAREDDENKEGADEKVAKKNKVKVPRIKVLKLNEVTKPLERSEKESLLLGAVKRLLQSRNINSKIRQKIITTIAASFNPVVREHVQNFIAIDPKCHIDLALAWLYEEYSIMQGFLRLPELRRTTRIDQSYNSLLIAFVNSASEDAPTLTRLILEAPTITEEALAQLTLICKNEMHTAWAMTLLKDLVMRRPTRQLMFLNALLEHVTHENVVIRECTITHVIVLHKCIEIRQNIEEYVRKCLDHLTLAQPPDELFGFNQGRLSGLETWTDDIAKACLEGYIALLPSNPSLIHDLAKVYIQTSADVKRVILRLLESPIRTMGMESTELLKLVQDCPKGSETLVTRVIHILTDKGPPSAQLVKRVRELYNTRVSDVRFLIPVLNGLTKSEIIAALPKLIKLNPVVVREVFNRLLGAHGDSSISPTELLVSLHILSTDQVDIKTKMKAITMCLNEKSVFTQEVLAVVLQQLMEQTPLPTLLMRTVIQALGLFPRLSGFVMNILQRLILKQVWKQKVAWEGFVKCCQRTKPQSFSVLMQLPAPQLSEALNMSPDMRDPLKEHLMSFSDSQRAHVPSAVQEILLGPTVQPVPPPVIQPAAVPADTIPNELEPLPPGMD